MEQILCSVDVFTNSFCPFLSVRDLCRADVAVSSNKLLAPLLKTLFLSPCLQQKINDMTQHMVATESLSDAQIQWLVRRGTCLRSISLHPSTSTAALATVCKHCSSLTSLTLSHCRLPSLAPLQALTSMHACPALSTLDLIGCKIDDDSSPLFSQTQSSTQLISSRLTKVRVRGCDFMTDGAVADLARQSPSLTLLDLSCCRQITDKSLKHISPNSLLSSLHLGHCSITDSGLISFSQGSHGSGLRPNLTHLDLSLCTRVSDAAVLSVAKACPSLEHISLRQCSGITAAAVIVLAKRCPHVAYLDLSGCTGVTDTSLQALSQMRSIKKDKDMGTGMDSHSHPALSTLLLRDTLISDIGVRSLSSCHSLTTLDLSGCHKITDASVTALSCCSHLGELIVRHCLSVTLRGLKEFGKSVRDFDLEGFAVVTIQCKVRCVQARRRVNVMRTEKQLEARMKALERLRVLEGRESEWDRELTTMREEVAVLRGVQEDCRAAQLLAEERRVGEEEARSLFVEAMGEMDGLKRLGEERAQRLVEKESACEALEKSCVQLTAEVQEERRGRNKAESELKQVNDVLVSRLDDLVSVSEEMVALRKKLEALQSSKTAVVSAKSGEIRELREEVLLLEALRVECEEGMTQKDGRVSLLESELREMKENLEEAVREADRWRTESGAREREVEKVRDELKNEGSRGDQLQIDLQGRHEEAAALAAELKNSERNVESLTAENVMLAKRNKELESLFLEAVEVGRECSSARSGAQKAISDIASRSHNNSGVQSEHNASTVIAQSEEWKGEMRGGKVYETEGERDDGVEDLGTNRYLQHMTLAQHSRPAVGSKRDLSNGANIQCSSSSLHEPSMSLRTSPSHSLNSKDISTGEDCTPVKVTVEKQNVGLHSPHSKQVKVEVELVPDSDSDSPSGSGHSEPNSGESGPPIFFGGSPSSPCGARNSIPLRSSRLSFGCEGESGEQHSKSDFGSISPECSRATRTDRLRVMGDLESKHYGMNSSYFSPESGRRTVRRVSGLSLSGRVHLDTSPGVAALGRTEVRTERTKGKKRNIETEDDRRHENKAGGRGGFFNKNSSRSMSKALDMIEGNPTPPRPLASHFSPKNGSFYGNQHSRKGFGGDSPENSRATCTPSSPARETAATSLVFT